MRRSNKVRARRVGEADGREHAKTVHDEEGIRTLLSCTPDWDVPARCALAASARLIPKAAHEIYYDSVNRGAARYIESVIAEDDARWEPVLQAARIYDAMRDR